MQRYCDAEGGFARHFMNRLRNKEVRWRGWETDCGAAYELTGRYRTRRIMRVKGLRLTAHARICAPLSDSMDWLDHCASSTRRVI